MSNANDFVIENGILKKYVGAGGDVVIPDGVTSIGDSAFHYCFGLASIVIPGSVTSIENRAFEGCTGLTSIVIPDSVTSIGNSAFAGCTGLASIVIPGGVTRIGNSAFYECTRLTSVIIPDSVTSIGVDAFSECSVLKRIVFSNESKNYEAMKDIEFSNICDTVEVLRAPSLPISELNAMKKQVAMGYLEAAGEGFIPSPEIAEGYDQYIKRQRKKLYPILVNDAKKLRYVLDHKLIPLADLDTCITLVTNKKEKTEITAMLLEYQNGFSEKERKKAEAKAFAMPTDVEVYKKLFTTQKYDDGTIGIENFKADETNVTVPGMIGKANVSKIGRFAFSPEKDRRSAVQKKACAELTSVVIGENVTTIEEGAFLKCKKIKEITLPQTLQVIERIAFAGCESLKKIFIPAEVKEIGVNAFGNCKKLESIEVDEKNTRYRVIDGVLYESTDQGTVFVKCPVNKKTVTIPEDVTVIAPYAFSWNKKLESIVIPKNVKIIGSGAFSACKALENIVLNHDTVLLNGVFEDCSNLKQIVLPEDMKVIPDGTFRRSGIENVTFPKELEKISYDAFRSCQGLSSIVLPDSVHEVGGSAFQNCHNLSEVILPEGLSWIGTDTFKECASLKQIVIPKGITKIPWGAFHKCKNMEKIVLHEGIIEIGVFAFDECPNATILAPKGSYAETYAKENRMPFVAK